MGRGLYRESIPTASRTTDPHPACSERLLRFAQAARRHPPHNRAASRAGCKRRWSRNGRIGGFSRRMHRRSALCSPCQNNPGLRRQPHRDAASVKACQRRARPNGPREHGSDRRKHPALPVSGQYRQPVSAPQQRARNAAANPAVPLITRTSMSKHPPNFKRPRKPAGQFLWNIAYNTRWGSMTIINPANRRPIADNGRYSQDTNLRRASVARDL